MRQEWGGSRGFTLAELLVAVAVVGMVLVSLGTLLQRGHQAYQAGAAQIEAQQSARAALERLARELRGAGLDPRGASFPALANPTPTGFTIQNDVNGDGVIAGNRERITYSLTGRILRRNAGGGAQPMIEGVESLAFTYLDGAGNPTMVPGEIRSVVIVITTRSDGGGTPRVSMTTQIRLRNR